MAKGTVFDCEFVPGCKDFRGIIGSIYVHAKCIWTVGLVFRYICFKFTRIKESPITLTSWMTSAASTIKSFL